MIGHTILAGLTLGVLSSFHCVGMCGPIAMALPVNHLLPLQKATAVLLYHTGRIITYMSLGLLFALLGRTVYIAGWQRQFSVVLGLIMLILAGYSLLSKRKSHPFMISKLYLPLQKAMGLTLRSRNIKGFLLLGVFNGLLPCGMVYMAIAGAMASSEITEGVLFMGFYGLGTFPAMLLISIFSYHINLRLRNTIRHTLPFIAIVMGLLFILRGMNLGIPYISPLLPSASRQAIICH